MNTTAEIPDVELSHPADAGQRSLPPQRIAYLAPEIPATSATFVYAEIVELQSRGIAVFPFSVHRPEHAATDPEASLVRGTRYLYERGLARLVRTVAGSLLLRPLALLRALGWAVHDCARTGLLSMTAAKLLYQFLVANSLAMDLGRLNTQHLHIHFAHVPTQIGMYAAAIAGIPFTFTAHANDLFERGILLREKALRAAKAITISNYNVRYLADLGVPREKLAVVRCGVPALSTTQFARKPRSGAARIGSLGRLVEKKGMDDLLRACAILADRGVGFELEIAGYGPLENELKRLATKLGIEERVSFLGALRHDRVSEWLRSLDVFALAARRDRNGDTDGIPVVLMEAMAEGIPTVSTRIGGIPELIEDGVSGLLSGSGEPEAFAENLLRLIKSEKDRNRLANGGRKQIEQEFSREQNAERLLRVFQEIHER